MQVTVWNYGQVTLWNGITQIFETSELSMDFVNNLNIKRLIDTLKTEEKR